MENFFPIESDLDRPKQSAGFTVLELLVVFMVISLICGMAFPKMSSMNANLNVSRDARLLSSKINEWRAEAIRTKIPVTITFTAAAGDTPANYAVDLDNDDSADQSISLTNNSHWSLDGTASVPGDLEINGLGLVTNLAEASTRIGVAQSDQALSFTLYRTGIVNFDD